MPASARGLGGDKFDFLPTGIGGLCREIDAGSVRMKVIYGENRAAAEQEMRRVLGTDYDVYEGETLNLTDLPSIFQGTTLFGAFEDGKRRILLKNLTERAEIWEKIGDYADSAHEVVIWEVKVDKRSTGYKRLAEKGVDFKEFKNVAEVDPRVAFGILDLALRDGEKALKEVAKIETTQDPYMFFGLLVSQMVKKYELSRGGERERVILKRMAEVDRQMKSTGVEPWTLVKGLLAQISHIADKRT